MVINISLAYSVSKDVILCTNFIIRCALAWFTNLSETKKTNLSETKKTSAYYCYVVINCLIHRVWALACNVLQL